MTRIRNEHHRRMGVDPSAAAALLDTVGTLQDRLWPREHWPAMSFSPTRAVGASGGHGPVGYRVEEYQPGSRIVFGSPAKLPEGCTAGIGTGSSPSKAAAGSNTLSTGRQPG